MIDIPAFTAARCIEKAGSTSIHKKILPQATIIPQTLCTPCVTVGDEKWCTELLGTKVCLPPGGRYKACCRVKFGWPSVKCKVTSC